MKPPSGPPTFKPWRPPREARAIRPLVRGSPRLRGYDARWDRLSVAFRRRHPFCRFCIQEGNDAVLADVVDHILAIVEFPELKYEWTNLESLCDPHNKSTKARLELLARKAGDFSQMILWCESVEVRRAVL